MKTIEIDNIIYKKLSEILTIKNGKDYKSHSKGNVPVYGSGGIISYIDTAVYDKPSVLIPRKGSLDKLYFVDTPFWNVDTIFYTEINTELVEPRYLYHYLKQAHLEKLNKAGGVPSLTQAVLNNLTIPLPPLPIQQEIVRILDTFTNLTAELTDKLNAELTARRKQYEYYRDELLTFGEDVDYKTLPEISVNCDRQRKPVTKGKRNSGSYPYYGASGIVDYVSDYIFEGDYLLISEDGANLLARSTPIAFSISGKNWVNNHAHVLKFETDVMRKYVEIYLNSIGLERYISGGAQPKLNQDNLNKILIPVPENHRIQTIVDILTKFDKLCNDLGSGIPAEISARQKQYEYYRNQLLTFKQIGG